MKLFLIRHGETVDNVAGLYAGSRDSPLTVHGVLQAERLGDFLAKEKHIITHIFSSDLQRAHKTAIAVKKAQVSSRTAKKAPPVASSSGTVQITTLSQLREQDFGAFEGKSFGSRGGDGKGSKDEKSRAKEDAFAKEVESKDSMARRSTDFLETHLNPIILSSAARSASTPVVAVVAHGLILSQLWKQLLRQLNPGSVRVSRTASSRDLSSMNLEHLGGWSNTGYLELDIHCPETKVDQGPQTKASTSSASPQREPRPLAGYKTIVVAVNGKKHLEDLKRTRGVGSSKHDESQKKLDTFFVKRRKTDASSKDDAKTGESPTT